MPSASAPHNVTRSAPLAMLAPPARAATAPSNASTANDVALIHAAKPGPGTASATARGTAAPAAKLAAEASAACSGRAARAWQMPSSSRACAPSASCAISCLATGPATPVSRMLPGLTCAAPTPSIRQSVETSPSLSAANCRRARLRTDRPAARSCGVCIPVNADRWGYPARSELRRRCLARHRPPEPISRP